MDNQGGYLDFTGRCRRGVMELRRDGGDAEFRMRWLDVEERALTWLWERRDAGARRWKTLWRLDYTRA